MFDFFSRHKIGLSILAVLAACIAALYGFFVFSDNPFIAACRTLYIETAMSTMTHQWLATAFLPESVIEEAMRNVDAQFEGNMVAASEIAAPEDEEPAVPVLPTGPEEQAWEDFAALFPEIDLSTMPESVTWENLPTLQTENVSGVAVNKEFDSKICKSSSTRETPNVRAGL